MDEWVSVEELLTALGAKAAVSSHTFAVCRRAHAGLLETRATALVVGDGKAKKDEAIPPEFWWAEGHEALEQDWLRGDFSTWMDVRDRQIHVKAFGVRFNRYDAEAMGARFPEPEPSPLVSLDKFDVEDQEAAQHWSREAWWAWIDAAIWVASRQPEQMKILAAYRSWLRRCPGQPLITEAARVLVAQSMVKPSALAAAEVALLNALRVEGIGARASRTPESILEPVDRSEWTRLARPSQRHTVALEDDPEAIVLHNLRLSSADVLARWPIPGEAVEDAPVVEPVDRAEWEAECKRVAALLDEEGVSVRDVRAHHVKARWNAANGKAPKKDTITGFMAGKPRDGRPGKVSR